MQPAPHVLRGLHPRQELVVFRAERRRIIVDRRYLGDQVGRIMRQEADIVAFALARDRQRAVVDVDLHLVGIELVDPDREIRRAALRQRAELVQRLRGAAPARDLVGEQHDVSSRLTSTTKSQAPRSDRRRRAAAFAHQLGFVLDRAHRLVLGDLDQVIGAVAAPALAVPCEPAQGRAPQQLALPALPEALGIAEVGMRIERQPPVQRVVVFRRIRRLAVAPCPPCSIGFRRSSRLGACRFAPCCGGRGGRQRKRRRGTAHCGLIHSTSVRGRAPSACAANSMRRQSCRALVVKRMRVAGQHHHARQAARSVSSSGHVPPPGRVRAGRPTCRP
jgi:hypothetical protein